jgi:hypothetical protein
MTVPFDFASINICPALSVFAFAGLNCNKCQFLATGKSLQVYTSSAAANIKKLAVANENINGASFANAKISGSLGDSTCGTQGGQTPCSGYTNGIGTFARYSTISGIALQVTTNGYGTDVALFIADQGNDAIRKLELTSGLNAATTFDTNVDPYAGALGASYLAGIAVNSATNMLYVGCFTSIYSYNLQMGASSKALLAGQPASSANLGNPGLGAYRFV